MKVETGGSGTGPVKARGVRRDRRTKSMMVQVIWVV